MKNITLFSFCLLLTSLLSAQVNTYADRTDFETAYSSTLMEEDFSGGPTDPSICGPIVSSAGNDCFAPGELIDGFELTTSGNTDVVYLPAGFLPSNNPTPRLGANDGAEYTVLSFTGQEDVYAVGYSIHVDNDANFTYRVYDKNNNLLFDELVPFTSFYGVISSQPIGRVEIEGEGGIGELVGDLAFGNDNVLAVTNPERLALNFYPNPVSTTLNINAKKIIKSITVLNLIGQSLATYKNDDNTKVVLDLSELAKGMYVLHVNFVDGGVSNIKVLKK